MATRKINNIKLLRILRGFNKPYYTVADFEKVLNLNRDSLYVLLNRLVKKGVLIRLKRGVYKPEFESLELEKIANELYYPSYLSFESALCRFSILNQIPYTLTFATNRTSKRLNLASREIEYRQLKDELFFGFFLKDGVYIAEPEKAILDQLYIMSKGRILKDTSEWSLVNLDKLKFIKYSRKFPKGVQNMAKKLSKRFGKYVVTL